MAEKLNKNVVFDTVQKVIDNTDCILIDVNIKKSADKIILELIIDKNGGVKIEDCEIVSKLVDPILDENTDIAEKYDFLTVSSAGIDRPFKQTSDFTNHIGEKIEVKLYAAIGKQKFIQDVLLEANDDYIVLSGIKENLKILRSNIQKVNIAIEF